MQQDAPPPAWPVLDTLERRVLGVLMEKFITTPDAYPLSLNALITGCNQKSNRDPVLDVNDLDVEDALARLQKQGLVLKIIGGRVDRWRHALYETWHLDSLDAAILAELLLRGPQTEGELRGRASRMKPFADLDALRRTLDPLSSRKLVVYLTPQGKRGTTLTHGFHSPEELEQFRHRHSTGETVDVEPVHRPAESARAEATAEIAQLRADVDSLRQELAGANVKIEDLDRQLQEVRKGLGM